MALDLEFKFIVTAKYSDKKLSLEKQSVILFVKSFIYFTQSDQR